MWKSWNCLSETRAISKFPKTMTVIYPKNHPNQTCGYWLTTPYQQTLYWKYYLLTVGNHKSTRGQLQSSRQIQNDSINSPMLITIKHVILFGFNSINKSFKFWSLLFHSELNEVCSDYVWILKWVNLHSNWINLINIINFFKQWVTDDRCIFSTLSNI